LRCDIRPVPLDVESGAERDIKDERGIDEKTGRKTVVSGTLL
jgi:hypothetical protein